MKKMNILKVFAIGLLCFIGISNVDAATMATPFDITKVDDVDHIYKVGDTMSIKIEKNSFELDIPGIGKFTNDIFYTITDGMQFVSCTGNITCDSQTKTITYDGTPSGEGVATFIINDDEDQMINVYTNYYSYRDDGDTYEWYMTPIYVESNDPNKSGDSSLDGIEFYYDATVNGNMISTYYMSNSNRTAGTPLLVTGGKTIEGDSPYYAYAHVGDVTLYISSMAAVVELMGRNDFKFKIISENRKSVTEYILRLAPKSDNIEYGTSDRYLRVNGSTSVYTFDSLFNIANNIPEEQRLVVKDKNQNIVDNTSKVATGMQVTFNDMPYTLVVSGDLTSDGKSSVADVAKSYQYLKQRIDMEDVYVKAGDVAGNDGKIKITDVSKIYQFVKNKISNLD